jgi:hypothetical protein
MVDGTGTTVYTYDVRIDCSARRLPIGTLTMSYDLGGGGAHLRSEKPRHAVAKVGSRSQMGERHRPERRGGL